MATYSYVQINDTFRYEDGDVIIQVSQHPSGIFLVHSDVLSEGSEYFRALLSHGWSCSQLLRTEDGETKRLWHLQMFFDREQKMCLLTDNVSSLTPSTGTMKG